MASELPSISLDIILYFGFLSASDVAYVGFNSLRSLAGLLWQNTSNVDLFNALKCGYDIFYCACNIMYFQDR